MIYLETQHGCAIAAAPRARSCRASIKKSKVPLGILLFSEPADDFAVGDEAVPQPARAAVDAWRQHGDPCVNPA
jgi:hypothetical protein